MDGHFQNNKFFWFFGQKFQISEKFQKSPKMAIFETKFSFSDFSWNFAHNKLLNTRIGWAFSKWSIFLNFRPKKCPKSENFKNPKKFQKSQKKAIFEKKNCFGVPMKFCTQQVTNQIYFSKIINFLYFLVNSVSSLEKCPA